MHRSLVLFIAAVAVFGSVVGDDECMPPKPGSGKATPPSDCCKLEKIMPAGLKSAAQKCVAGAPRPPKPSGPPPSGGMPSSPPKEMLDHHACVAECIFNENKLLNSDKSMNEAAVKTFFISADKEFKPVIDAALSKCLASYKTNIDKSLNCTSGAMEFEKCALREVITNCPSSSWTSSPECDELKTKVAKCPHLPFMGMKDAHR